MSMLTYAADMRLAESRSGPCQRGVSWQFGGITVQRQADLLT